MANDMGIDTYIKQEMSSPLFQIKGPRMFTTNKTRQKMENMFVCHSTHLFFKR